MKSGIKTRLFEIPSVIGLEPTYLNKSFGKWLVVVTKAQKDQARRAIDTVINETLFPDYQTERPGRSNKYNINSSLVTYAAALQKESTYSTIQFIKPPHNAYKRPNRVSYDLDNDAFFPVIDNKKNKSSPKQQASEYNTTSAIASVTNDVSTIVLPFYHDDFLKMLDKKIRHSKKISNFIQERSHSATATTQ